METSRETGTSWVNKISTPVTPTQESRVSTTTVRTRRSNRTGTEVRVVEGRRKRGPTNLHPRLGVKGIDMFPLDRLLYVG